MRRREATQRKSLLRGVVVGSKCLIGAGSAQRVVEGECVGEVRAGVATRVSIILISAKHSAIISESPGSDKMIFQITFIE